MTYKNHDIFLQKSLNVMKRSNSTKKNCLCALLFVSAIGIGCGMIQIHAMEATISNPMSSLAHNGKTESHQSTSESIMADDNTKSTDKSETRKDRIYTEVDVTAKFVGGFDALKEYVYKNLNYPENALKNKIQGRVMVSFVIEKDGSIADVKVARGVDEDLDKEAVRVLASMPKWKPAEVAGKAVASSYVFPVTFRLAEPKKMRKTLAPNDIL